VLTALGYSEIEIARLAEQHVIAPK
jgi:hypothetical protein